MKELTYADWVKNTTPRLMWVWDANVKIKRKVIYFIENEDVSHPVIALSSDGIITANYKHCAEIEEPRRMTYKELSRWLREKPRRMTYKELSRWLREKPTREYKYITGSYIYASFDYREKNQNVEVHESMRIRENDGEWKEPLIEEFE